MRTDALDYDLPDSAIAQRPAEPRDAARLLVALGDTIQHRTVADLPALVGPGDVVVVNDTRVIPARVPVVRSTGGRGEVLLLDEAGEGWWEALLRPARKLHDGDVLTAQRSASSSAALRFEVGSDLGEGRRLVRPVHEGELLDALDEAGEMPLPPYLSGEGLDDPDRYQTVYADRPGSAAAPTAGLHFTPELLAAVAATGAVLAHVELAVGLGTFRPITVERVEDHEMHRERYRVPPETWDAVQRAERVVAVGTTTVRALESAAASGELSGATTLFITPSYRWQVVDVLLTNFHLPRSSLLAMVEAFVGPRWRDLYATALREGYRFLSFGDAMLLERAPTDPPVPPTVEARS